MKYISPLYGHLPRRDVYLDLTSKDVVGYVGTIVFCILLSKVSELDFPLDKQLSFIYKKISKDCYSFLRLVAEISGLDVRLGQNEISYCLEEFENLEDSESLDQLIITTSIALYLGDKNADVNCEDLEKFQALIKKIIFIKLTNLIQSILDIRLNTNKEEQKNLISPLNHKFQKLYNILNKFLSDKYSEDLKLTFKTAITNWLELVGVEFPESEVILEVRRELEKM